MHAIVRFCRLLALTAGYFTLAVGVTPAVASEVAPNAAVRYDANALGWSLRLPTEENVVYHGVVNYDSAGGAASPLVYVVPNIAGFFAALATHGLINKAAQAVQKSKIQDAADQVLVPYQQVLGAFKYMALMQRALEKSHTGGNKRVAETEEKPTTGLYIDSVPVFSMTQDQSALVMDNVVVVYAPGTVENAIYQNVIRVVSGSERRDDLLKFWTANDGDALKAESARLVAESLDLALAELAAGPEQTGAQRTVRYLEGAVERMERGQIISERCGKIVLRTLRGWLMSVPAKPGAAPLATCVETAIR